MFFFFGAQMYTSCVLGVAFFVSLTYLLLFCLLKKNDGEAKTEKRKKMIKEDNQGKLITKPSVVYNKPYS